MIYCNLYLVERTMTRWARGENANKKKPMNSTKWSDMRKTSNSACASTIEEESPSTSGVPYYGKKLKRRREKVKQKYQDEDKVDVHKKHRNKKYELKVKDIIKSTPELVNADKDSLVELIHKDERREDRRQKRIDKRQIGRVGGLITFITSRLKAISSNIL